MYVKNGIWISISDQSLLETVKRVRLIWPVNWRERAILPASSDWSSYIQMNQSELVLSPYAYIRHVSKHRLLALQVLTLNSNKVIVHLNSWFSAIIPLKVYICIRTKFACTEVFKGIFWSRNMILKLFSKYQFKKLPLFIIKCFP